MRIFFQKRRIPSYSASWNSCPSYNFTDGKSTAIVEWKGNDGEFSRKEIEINITLTARCGIALRKSFIIDTGNISKFFFSLRGLLL